MFCTAGTGIYTIMAGDTIEKLAQRFSVSVNSLLEVNHSINPDALQPGQLINIPRPWSKYNNKAYKVSFMYPPLWAKINELHYAGIDGFFRISMLQTDKALEELCALEAYHKLKPYGSHPKIAPVSAADCEACLVLPSEDQPSEMKKQAVIVIKYPKAPEIGSKTYSHLIVWSDLEHLYDIKNSMHIES